MLEGTQVLPDEARITFYELAGDRRGSSEPVEPLDLPPPLDDLGLLLEAAGFLAGREVRW